MRAKIRIKSKTLRSQENYHKFLEYGILWYIMAMDVEVSIPANDGWQGM